MSLSTTRAELNVAVMGMQDASFVKYKLKSLELKVKLPMFACIDNGRAVDIGNNGSVGRRTCHLEVKKNFYKN